MSQTLNNIWIEELEGDYESIHQGYIYNLGNLTLIRHNQELGNKPFDNRKEIYNKNFGLQITKKEIINRSKWNENTIQNRSEWITQFIVEKAIPIPDEKR